MKEKTKKTSWALVIGYATIEGKQREFRVVHIGVSSDKTKIRIKGAIMKENHFLDKFLTKRNVKGYVTLEAPIIDYNSAVKELKKITHSHISLWDFDKSRSKSFKSLSELTEEIKAIKKTRRYIA